jgi:hypothetical protein
MVEVKVSDVFYSALWYGLEDFLSGVAWVKEKGGFVFYDVFENATVV